MAEEYTVRPYRPGDEGGIVQLLELVFDGWPRFDLGCSSLQHWRWKFRDNPFGMGEICVAEHGSRIIGAMHSVPVRIKVGGETFVGGQVVDNAVHEDFRRLGVYGRMIGLLKEYRFKRGEAFGYGVSENPIVWKTLKKKDRPLHVLPVTTFLWIKDFERYAEAHHTRHSQSKKIGYKILRTYNRLKKSFERSVEGGGFSVNRITNFDERMNELWREASKGFDYIIERGSDYMNWRYCDPRGGSYEVLAATESGGLMGYAVLRVNRHREEYPTGHVADILALPGKIGVVDSLLEESFRIFNEAGVNEVYCWMSPGHSYEGALERRGFLDLGKRVSYTIAPNLIDIKTLENKLGMGKKIHIMIGDSDWI